MSALYPDSVYGENTFSTFLDAVENPPAETQDSQAGEEVGQGAGAAQDATPVAGAAGAGKQAGAADGAEVQTERASDSTARGGAAGADAPADSTAGGAASTGYVPDPAWEKRVVEQLGAASTEIAKRVQEDARTSELAAMREEFESYFQAAEIPARNLIGKTVPSLDPDKDTEVIRDLSDAQDYQQATRETLVKELQSRVSNTIQENQEYLQVVGQSIDMIQANPDLLRDRQLADRVAQLIQPYEYRQDGKLLGWSVNVLPLVARVREQLKVERAAKKAPPVSQPAKTQKQAAPPADPPQAGLRSSATQTGESDSFDQLWSTLGFSSGQVNI